MGSISAANAEFCFDVFNELKVHHVNENILYSPLSIIAALAMVYLGARGNTEYQMEKVLHFDSIAGLGGSVQTKQDSKPVQMMIQNSTFKVATVAAEKMKILELPYASGELSMLVLLPDEVSGLEQIENTISFEKLTQWTSSTLMEERRVKVYLPRMKIEEKYNLTSVLVALGMTDLFSPSANLSAISSTESLKMSQAVHGAYMVVNEEGTEVAGSTGVVGDIKTSPEFEEFRADHPFLFLIKHNPTNSIVYFGRYCSP
ncbi:ovalbumin-related protein Y-like [Oxyura jamaicensis]|uniref:ovalbumin-related protein Y-like n=1 Tax=Oxyura jamaicensis TaxID=8884 RepID=UPI0015A5BA71|nr:ovalbumin-related protein Y-like [Oxyura jamaicensis]